MPHSKTPGQSQAASDKFLKKDAEAHGVGADNAPGRSEHPAPGERPVASDSATSAVGVEKGTNNPGEKGLKDQKVVLDSNGGIDGQANMK